MKYLFILAMFFSFVSCGTKKNAVNTENQSTDYTITMKPERNVMLKAKIGEFRESDAFEINDVLLEGNTLFVNISFTGGCGKHSYEVIGNRAVMKSLPPKRSFMIAHDAVDEKCESLTNKTLEIDLKNLASAQTPGNTIMLLLDGLDE